MLKIFGRRIILFSLLNVILYLSFNIAIDRQSRLKEASRLYSEQQYLLELVVAKAERVPGISKNPTPYRLAYEKSLNQAITLQNGGWWANLFSTNEEAEMLVKAIQQSWTRLLNVLTNDPIKKEILDQHLAAIYQDYSKLLNFYDAELDYGIKISTWFTIVLCLVNVGFVVYFRWLLSGCIHQPLQKIRDVAERLARGDLSKVSGIRSSTEVGRISEALDEVVKNQLTVAAFADEIGNRNYSGDYNFGAEDQLGLSLSKMRDQLKASSAADEKRLWANEGFNEFTTLLRNNQDDIKVMSDRILSRLVRYVNANQGALFMLRSDEEEEYLELMATYAWDRKKFLTKRVEVRQGLLGEAVLDADTVYVTDVPADFINITSGLGDTNPSAVLIVPLKINDTVHGVVELASLHEFKKHQIEFVEKLAENIASVLSNMKINEHTRRLLEDSQSMAEKMRSQEEELRQNAEELEASKEDLSRKLEEATHEMKLRIQEIENERRKNIAVLESCVDGVITFNQKGEIEFLNKAAEEIWDMQRHDFLGESIKKLLPIEFTTEYGKLNAKFIQDNQVKTIDVRTEVLVANQAGEEISVLLTLSEASVGAEMTFTIFVQRISVELF